jgi:hypothetical protein
MDKPDGFVRVEGLSAIAVAAGSGTKHIYGVSRRSLLLGSCDPASGGENRLKPELQPLNPWLTQC